MRLSFHHRALNSHYKQCGTMLGSCNELLKLLVKPIYIYMYIQTDRHTCMHTYINTYATCTTRLHSSSTQTGQPKLQNLSPTGRGIEDALSFHQWIRCIERKTFGFTSSIKRKTKGRPHKL